MVTGFMEDSSKTTIEFKGTKRDVGGTSYLFPSWTRGGECGEPMPALTQASGWDGERQIQPGPRLCHGMLPGRWILETSSSWHVKRNTYQEETKKALFKKKNFRQKSRNDGSIDFQLSLWVRFNSGESCWVVLGSQTLGFVLHSPLPLQAQCLPGQRGSVLRGLGVDGGFFGRVIPLGEMMGCKESGGPGGALPHHWISGRTRIFTPSSPGWLSPQWLPELPLCAA